MSDDLSCPAAAVIPECPQSMLLARHSHSLDRAHEKLRAHDSDIEALKRQTSGCFLRLEAMEKSQFDMQQTMQLVSGKMSILDTRMNHLDSTTTATHGLIVKHIARGILIEEHTWKRFAKITGIVTAILVIVSLLYSALSDRFWTLVTGLIGFGG
ncbi:MAG: hypothetical protein MZV65_38980 [Chromatiales bacterium]|nr:hypothetical protein [Chromatiales bacterium]